MRFNFEDECFQILPKACLELVEFLWQMNIDVRTSSDYKQLARAILFKYEVLEGIISRYIVKGLLAGFPNPPKNSQVSIVLSCESNKSIVDLTFQLFLRIM